MYTQYFGLNKAPFKITPDPEFFFSGGNRGAVLEALLYAVARGEGIVKVVGEVGSGKTMLCRMLECELPSDCEIVYLANPRLSPDEILQAIAIELHLEVQKDASKVEVMRLLHAFLLEKHANNRSVVMFIEEAQGMDLETLEEIRMLSNLETTQDKLLQIVLFGQPELNEKLRVHEIRQLKERITYSFDLAPLNRTEIRDYLNTRIRTSGYRGNDLFSAAAIRSLKRRSGGLLRRINILADKALLAAFSRGDRLIKPVHLRMAAKDSEFDARAGFEPAMVIAGVAIAAVLIVGGAWWASQPIDPKSRDRSISDAASVVPMPETATGSAAVESSTEPSHDAKIEQVSVDFDEVSTKLELNGDVTLNREVLEREPLNPLVSRLLAASLISLDDLEPDTSPALTAESLVDLFE